MDALALWSPKRWAVAALASLLVGLAVGLPSDVIPNPVFGRPVDVTWWSYPVLVVTAVLGGLLAATYIRMTKRSLSTTISTGPAELAGSAGCCRSSRSAARRATN